MRLGAGEYLAGVVTGFSADASTVSLRAEATNPAGGKVEQTMVDAYELAR